MAVVRYLDGYIDGSNNEYGLTDTVAQASITAIKDGSTIDSFADVESALGNKISKSSTSGLVKNDGTIDTTTYVSDVSGKADTVSSATNGNFAGLDANGNLTDSGHKPSDYITSHQDISGKADKVTSATNGNFAGLDSNGNLTDSGKKASDFATASSVTAIEGKIPSSASTSNKLATASDVNDIWSANAVLGVHQWLDKSKIAGYNATITQTTDGVQVTVANKPWASGYVNITGLPLNTAFKLSSNVIVTTAGTMMRLTVQASKDGGSTWTHSYMQNITASGKVELEFNTLDDTYFRIYLYVNGETAATSDITFGELLLKLADDASDDVTDYAMTNVEFTEASRIRSVTPAVDGTVLKAIVNNKAVVQYDLITRMCRFAILATVGTFTHNTAAITGLPKCKQLTGFTFITSSNTTDPIMGGLIDTNQTSISLQKLEGASYPEDSNYVFSGSYMIADDVVS